MSKQISAFAKSVGVPVYDIKNTVLGASREVDEVGGMALDL